MLYVPRLPNVIAQAQIPKVPSDKSPAVGSMYHYGRYPTKKGQWGLHVYSIATFVILWLSMTTNDLKWIQMTSVDILNK